LHLKLTRDLHLKLTHPAGGLHDGLCIIGVVFVGLEKGFDELRADQLHHVAVSLEDPCPVIGSSARFHHDSTGWQIGQVDSQLKPRQSLSENRLAGTVDAVKLKGVPDNINAQYAHSHDNP